MPPQNQQVKVNVNPEVAKGVYSNMMEIKHAQEEFCLDFFSIFPPVGALSARVIVSPGHLKRMIRALKDNLERYEKAFGDVDEAAAPQKPNIGFVPN